MTTSPMTPTYLPSLIERLITAATGEPYGDGTVVMDIIIGDADTGENDKVIVLGNWNDKTWTNPTKADRLPSRLFDALEWSGADCRWHDEYSQCGECYRAVRTQPDSYSWTMGGSWSKHGLTCTDCLKQDPNGYLDDYVNNSDKAVTWLSGSELKAIGFSQWALNDPQSYENGWHPGQTDEPSDILKAIHERDISLDVVFLIDSVGQFDVRFSAYTRSDDYEQD